MAKVCVFTADGFEEIEGLTVVDLLRRAGAEVLMVSISDGLAVQGSHGIEIKADCFFDDVDYNTADLLVLPGGVCGPGKDGCSYLCSSQCSGKTWNPGGKTGCLLSRI